MPAIHPIHRLGFTLIELMVVVTIILILLGFLLPAVDKASILSKTTICESNLKQVGTGLLAYQFDNRMAYPNSWDWAIRKQTTADNWDSFFLDDQGHSGIRPISTSDPGSTHTHYGGLIWPYVPDEKAFFCPAWVELDYWAANNRKPGEAYVMSESIGQAWNGQAAITQFQDPNQDDAGVKPGEALVLGEENPYLTGNPCQPYTRNNTCLGAGNPNDAANHVDAIASYHNAPGGDPGGAGAPRLGGSNVFFMDGHVGLHYICETKKLCYPYSMRWQ